MVCCVPETKLFGPLNGGQLDDQTITMTIDEYEIIRLIDVEGLTPAECAERMLIARATIQTSYQQARNKLGQALVNGRVLQIEGGDFQLYNDDQRNRYGCGRHQRNRFNRG